MAIRSTMISEVTSTMTAGNWTQWTDDVLESLKLIGLQSGSKFDLEMAYRAEPMLQRIYPNNNNIQAKIRQQLQILQEHGYVRFVDNSGNYEMLKV